MPDGSIQLEHVWKKFRADKTVPKFYDQMTRFRRSIGSGNRYDYRWVLKDITLEVEPGKSLALIGINGSGKTTLLKIISQITYQSAGRCDVAGRIGALLSVTAGIHMELTGKENIFLYGAVMGMGRQSIRTKYDEIVEFAGLADAVDRQVKFYSLGMQMRLGFSIAAFLEPDVLLVDEVLAVGDANFQQKCLKRIGEIVKAGTTLLYVSHDLASVEATCETAVWLADAVAVASGPTREVVSLYRKAVEQNAALTTSTEGLVEILKVEIEASDGGQLRSECDLVVRLRLNSPEAIQANIFLGVSQGSAFPMFIVRHDGSFPAGDCEVVCTMRHVPLSKGRYSLWPAMSAHAGGKGKPLLPWRPAMSFDVMGPDFIKLPEGVMVMSNVYVGSDWEIN
ncbi:MAG: ATP-binding cassette domain-containing protein [Acidimicrobiales bacterium]|nr:ATP-binding cassette domain-containing protein [Acidimicrobiales bacterium]